MPKEIITTEELIQKISKELSEWDGKDIVELYNERFGIVTYLGDSLVQIDEN